MRSLIGRLIALCLGAVLCLAPPALAQLRIDITKGNVDPLPTAVPDLGGASPEERKLGADIAAVVRNDLQRSGYFRMIDPQAFVTREVGVDSEPIFADWRAISTQALIVGRVKLGENNKLTVEFRLWDIIAGKVINFGQKQDIDGLSFTTPVSENWRKLGHKIADEVYARLTGDPGYFDTSIAFISESGPRTNRRKRLAIMDQDGANPTFLPAPGDLILTPRFSPSGQQLTYLSLSGGKPRVYLLNIETGRQEILGNFQMSFAPRFAPDGRSMLMSVDLEGNTEIFSMNLQTREAARLTNDRAIDTSPTYSPDGRKIVFNSDRSGTPQLYVMNPDGTNVQRISQGDGKYTTPVWSPRGDLIAFTKQLNGRFYIGVMAPDGTGERILTDGYLVESPDWSPNGRVIIFNRESGPGAGPKLYSIDLLGRNLLEVPTRGDASDPSWSPLNLATAPR